MNFEETQIIQGQETTVIVSVFSDVTRVVLSQTGKFGNWISATRISSLPIINTTNQIQQEREEEVEGGNRRERGNYTYSVDVLLGDRENIASLVLARKLCETVCSLRNDDTPLLLCVALKDFNPPRHVVLSLLSFLQSAVTSAFHTSK